MALGYEDLNDHDDLRKDSTLALLVGKRDLTGERRVREQDRGNPLAASSTLNQWDLLTGYLADGRLNSSNALAENAIRPFAVGRRNWLFADTPRGAKASATIYSLIETAKANGLEPFAYLYHVLRHIGGASTVEDIEALLPWKTPLKKMQEG